MINEITQEERERIIANIKGYIDNCKGFYGMIVARVIQADYDDDDECWNKLLALIESAPAQQECIPCPLDADGVPCKIDDVVYYKDEAIYIEYCDSKFVVYSDEKGYLHELYASEVTHKEPRTLEDIKNDVLYSGLTSDSESLTLSLIEEAYKLGQKASKNE